MEVILLWKKTKTFFGLSKILNIFTKKWGDCDCLNLQKASDLVVPKNQSGLSLKVLTNISEIMILHQCPQILD